MTTSDLTNDALGGEPGNDVPDVEFRIYNESDNLNVLCRDGELFDFEIDEPWAGDTETGFGQGCDISLTASQALELADWIRAHIERKPKDGAPPQNPPDPTL